MKLIRTSEIGTETVYSYIKDHHKFFNITLKQKNDKIFYKYFTKYF